MARIKPAHAPSQDSATPILVMLSRDQELGKIVQRVAGLEWTVIRSDIDQLPRLVREPNLRLAFFDDQSVPPMERGRALAEIQRYASRASIVYVAGAHDHESERLARGGGVLFYTAKPLRPGDVALVLERLLRMHRARPDLRIARPQPRIRQA